MKANKIKKPTKKLPMQGGVRKGFMFYCGIVMMIALICCTSLTAFAASDDPLTVVNNLSDFIFSSEKNTSTSFIPNFLTS